MRRNCCGLCSCVFLLMPTGFAHVLLRQPLLVPGNLADATGKTKRAQYCRPPPPTCLAGTPATRLGSTLPLQGQRCLKAPPAIYGEGPSSPRTVASCSQGCGRSCGHGHTEPPGAAGTALSHTAAGTAPAHPVGDAHAGLQSCCRCFSVLAASLENKVPNQSESKWRRTAPTFLLATNGVSRAMGLELLSSQMNRSNGHINAAL